MADATAYSFSYSHYQNGVPAAVTYPVSGRVVTTCVDVLGRVLWVSATKTQANCVDGQGPAAAGEAYASGASYKAFGRLAAMALGNGLHETTEYNGRQQQWWRGLGTAAAGSQLWKEELVYGAGAANNGNVASAALRFPTATGSTTTTTRFDYDKANRLTMGIEGWAPTALPTTSEGQTAARCQQFSYDFAGNALLSSQLNAHPGVGLVPGYTAATNRITGTNWGYDSRGNLTSMPARSALVNAFALDGPALLVSSRDSSHLVPNPVSPCSSANSAPPQAGEEPASNERYPALRANHARYGPEGPASLQRRPRGTRRSR